MHKKIVDINLEEKNFSAAEAHKEKIQLEEENSSLKIEKMCSKTALPIVWETPVKLSESFEGNSIKKH